MNQSRFFFADKVKDLCPNDIRLFYSNQSVNVYNNKVMGESEHKTTLVPNDNHTGYNNAEQC